VFIISEILLFHQTSRACLQPRGTLSTSGSTGKPWHFREQHPLEEHHWETHTIVTKFRCETQNLVTSVLPGFYVLWNAYFCTANPLACRPGKQVGLLAQALYLEEKVQSVW